MSESFYGQPPKRNLRYVRNLEISEKGLILDLKRSYKVALEKKATKHYENVNKVREELQVLKIKIEGILEEFSIEHQVTLSKILDRIRESLGAYPELEIPPPTQPPRSPYLRRGV